MGDWANEKAKHYYELYEGYVELDTLAASYREVAGTHVAHIHWQDPGRDYLMRKNLLAEVRRVIEETPQPDIWDDYKDQILSRLEKL